MSKTFRNRYRIKSARAPWWDYGAAAAYFITICTKARHHFFGEIQDGKMYLSHVGVIADLMWYEIQYHAKNCRLGPFIVMPDHVHRVLKLKDNDKSILNERLSIPNDRSGNPIDPLENQDERFSNRNDHIENPDDRSVNPDDRSANRNVETRHALSLHFDLLQTDLARTDLRGTKSRRMDLPKSRFQNQGKNTISSIVGSYKSAVTKHAHRLGYEFAWQPRFYDHIIRDPDEMARISTYIRSNVQAWERKIYRE